MKAQYRDTISKWIRKGKLSTLQHVFEQIIEGEEDSLKLLNEVAGNEYSHFFEKTPKGDNSKNSQRNSQPKKNQKSPRKEWMRKRAIKHGKFLRFQRPFHFGRGKLANIILDEEDSSQCTIPLEEVSNTCKSRWESQNEFTGLGAFQSLRWADKFSLL